MPFPQKRLPTVPCTWDRWHAQSGRDTAKYVSLELWFPDRKCQCTNQPIMHTLIHIVPPFLYLTCITASNGSMCFLFQVASFREAFEISDKENFGRSKRILLVHGKNLDRFCIGDGFGCGTGCHGRHCQCASSASASRSHCSIRTIFFFFFFEMKK